MIRESLKKARIWRDNEGYRGKVGVVIVFENQVQGWVNTLRNPEDWRPGSIAVFEDGTCYLASGGDDQNGAESWRPIETVKKAMDG